jgi:hypothetical protein
MIAVSKTKDLKQIKVLDDFMHVIPRINLHIYQYFCTSSINGLYTVLNWKTRLANDPQIRDLIFQSPKANEIVYYLNSSKSDISHKKNPLLRSLITFFA